MPIRDQDAAGASAELLRLSDAVRDLLAIGPEGDPRPFEGLALDVHRHQYALNAPYREYCDACGAGPSRVRSWHDIPAYPTDAFKREIVASFPIQHAVQAIMTSGTTSPNQRGRIFRDELGRELVFAANRIMTGTYLFPDLHDGGRCRLLILAPGPDLAPSMGMAIGMEQTRRAFGTEDSGFLVGLGGLNVRGLIAGLREAEASDEPVALIGATSAYVYFFNACREKGLRFHLPEGSRVADGGGYRGRFGVLTREDYYALAERILGVPERMCVNILGMGESATNYPDDVLRNAWLGRHGPERHKPIPPWTRVLAVDPQTGDVLEHGRPGLLRHYDVVNLPTVVGVQTDNLGFTDERGGFEIIGRAKVVDGHVSELPSEAPAGPMGDTRVFRLLEAYVNFSIDFKMGRARSSDPKSTWEELRRASDRRDGHTLDAVPSCPTVVEELVAGTDDPDAKERAERALGTFERENGS